MFFLGTLPVHQLASLGVIVIGKRAQQQVTWQFWVTRVLPVGACHAATLVNENAGKAEL
jgi:hypothetical protein